MSDITPAIVVVAYNRPNSITRILKSLEKANYPSKNINLIISIDKGNNNLDVVSIANKFQWQFGDKIVYYREINLGLRNHILRCGDLSQEYGSIILLEDDLYVSPNFYFYAQEALFFSDDKEYIAGVSLYNHQLNVHTREGFHALEDDYDNWYFQFASSWGQAWTSNQWNGFKEWYGQNMILRERDSLPKNVTNWSDKSWLKFFIAYLIEKDKYFMYPKISFTTNFGDIGAHMENSNTIYQVPLSYRLSSNFSFSEIEESQSVYDSFYENENLFDKLGLKKEDLCVDLYGHKPLTKNKKFYLTSKILNFKIEKSFSRSLRPIDSNIIENIYGEDLFLYNTSKIVKNVNKEDRLKKLSYDFKAISYKSALFLAIQLVKIRIKQLIR